MADAAIVKEALRQIFSGIDLLKSNSRSGRKFTIDSRLVGDIGEVIAEREFELTLDEVSRKGHDAKTADGRDVQVKATLVTASLLRQSLFFFWDSSSRKTVGTGSFLMARATS